MATRFFPRYSKNLIISRFGMRKHPILKINKMHNGIDINATNDGKTGQTDYITAHTGGTVEAVGYDLSAGNYIKIRTDSKTLMVYYHMKNKSERKKGDKVAKGDRIGYVGNSGAVTGKHLHFGIQFDGAWIDPEPYLDADWKQPSELVSLVLPVLRRGDKGETVRAIQALLILRGFDCGEKGTDGSFGADTRAAVEAFQGASGLEVTGTVTGEEWSKLILR